jgi:hypothetical protein
VVKSASREASLQGVVSLLMALLDIRSQAQVLAADVLVSVR